MTMMTAFSRRMTIMQTIDPGVLSVQPEHAYGGEPRDPLDMVPFDLATPDTAPDEMQGAAARRISAAVGVPDPDGRIWQGRPFASGAAYLDYMRGLLKSGDVWEYVASDELKAFEAADDAGRVKIAREALGFVDRAAEAAGRAFPEGYGFADGAPELRGAGEDVLAANARLRGDAEAAARHNARAASFAGDFRPLPEREGASADRETMKAWRRQREDGRLVSEHREKLLRENLAVAWLSLSPALSPRAKEIAAGVFRDGKLRPSDIADFQRLPEDDQRAVARLARLSRNPAAGTFWNTLGDAGIGFFNGVVQLPVNAYKQIGTLTTSIDQAVFGKDAGLVDSAEMNRRARTEQLLREALDDPAGVNPLTTEHGYLARSLIGAVSTLPYMAYASAGAPGFAAVMADFMQRLDDEVAAGGGDVYGRGAEWQARKLLYGAMYAGIERVSALPVWRNAGDVAAKTMFIRLASQLDDAAVARVAAHIGKQTLVETLEESAQAVIESRAKSVGLDRGDGWAAAARDGVKEFGETFGTMTLVSGFGAARQGFRAASPRGRAELAEYTPASLRRAGFILSDNPYAGRGTKQAVEDSWVAAAHVMDGYRQTWSDGGIDALKKRTDITEEQAAVLDHIFAAEREEREVDALITGRDMVARTEGGKEGEPPPALGWEGVRQIVAESGADAESRLAELDFTEAGAARVAGYLRQEAALTQRMVRVLGDIRDRLARDTDAGADPHRAEQQRRAIRAMKDLQPLRTVYQRAGTRDAAAKAFRAMKFTDKQANDLADAFDEERRLAVSPMAASAWKAAYLSGSRELSPAERLRRMTGFEAAPAPEHGPGAQILTLRGSDGQKRGEILFRPDSAVAFDPESAHAAEAVEQFTGGLITAAEWRALTPEERAQKTREHGFVAAGGFTVTDPADPSVEATGAQADILTGRIDLAPDAPSAELYHEAAHAWLAAFRRAGKLTDADVARLREAYGPSPTDPAWFNEEKFADDIKEIGAETDYGSLHGGRFPLARRFVAAVRRFAGAARAEESRRAAASGARRALFENIVYGRAFEGVGDFAAVPAASADGKAGRDSPLAGASTAPDAAETPKPETPETRNQKPETPETRNQKPETPAWTAATPQGNIRVGGRWALLPRDRFISDTDPRYDFSLQNRSRDAALGSSEQVASIVANFDALRLLDAPDTAAGAPVAVPVTIDGKEYYMVLSGNGRFRALDALDANHRGDLYRKPVQAFADERGIPYDPAHLTAEARPRLVRVLTRRPVGVTLQKLAELSNQNTVLQMTDAERAYSDAALIERDGTAGLFAANKDGMPSRSGSDEFFAWFVRAAGDASLLDSRGRPTDAARARARRAMLALAVGRGRRGKETVMAFTEQAESLGLERQRDALLMSAGTLTALGESKPEYALADEISRAAADLLMLARERKGGKAVTVDAFIGQGDMLDAMPPAAAEALRLLDSARPAEGIAEAFRRYADLASKIDTATDDMFGEPPAAAADLLRKAAADTDVSAPAGPRYSIALAARRYALATGMPQEGEELTRRQLEFLFADTADAASRRELAARALARPDDPEAWDAAFRASPDNTVSRIVHEFYMEHTGDQIWNAGMHYFPRAYNGRLLRGMSIRTARDAAAILMPLRNPWQESMKAIYVERGKRRHRVIGGEICTIGLLDTSMVHPREIFKRAVQWNADGIILSHNHPSGDPTPSKEDRAVTLRLEEAGRHLGIEYIDHIITNGRSFYSLRHDRLEAFDPGAKADWEAVPGGTAPRIRDFDVDGNLIGALRQGAGDVIHAIALDTKNRITAVRRIPVDPARLDTGVAAGDAGLAAARDEYTQELMREIFRLTASHPAAGMILDLTAAGIPETAALTLHNRARHLSDIMGVSILDALYAHNGWAYSVAAGRQIMPLKADAAPGASSVAETRYSLAAVTPAEDAEYMRAVEAGDMETAQRMVDEAALRAGYDRETFRGDSMPDDIVVYEPRDRREVGIFTTPVREIADVYAGGRLSNTSRRFYVRAPKVLDLTQDSLANMRWVNKWSESFDEWIDRQSGEERSAWDILQDGRMFDYEGDWSAERWGDLQATAELEGYDAVVLPDYDNGRGVFPSLVVFDSNNLKLADPVTRDDAGNVIPLSQRFDTASDDIRYSLEARAAYYGNPANAPRRPIAKIRLMTSPAALKAHPDYEAAKAGDRAAAIRVASSLSKADKIQALAADHPGAVLVPVLAEEATGSNQLPAALAAVINVATGLKVDHGIVQSVRAHRTGQGHLYRMAHRPKFTGDVTEGQEYILVDDLAAMGGTLAEMRHYIETHGGIAVDAVTLAAGRFGNVFGLTPKTEAGLIEGFGVEYLTELLKRSNLYGGKWKYLSEGEGRELLKALPPDAGRDGASAGRGPRDQPLRGGAPGGDPGRARHPPVRYALDLTGESYSKENLIVGYMAHADLTGSPFPSRATVAALADAIGLERHRYSDLAERAHILAASTVDDAIRRAAASAAPDAAAFAIGELARAAERALVRAGAAEGARLARSGERIRSLAEAGVAAAMRAVTGADYADLQTDTGIDIAASLLAADPKAFGPEEARKRDEAAGAVLPDPFTGEGSERVETDEDAPGLTDAQRAEIARKRRERESRAQAMLDAAAARASTNRARDEERRRRREAAALADAEDAAGGGEAGADAASGGDAPADPVADALAADTAAPIDLSDRWLAAAILRVWAFARFRRENPLRHDTRGDLTKNRVAVEFYRKTAVRQLTDLARKLLEPGAPRESIRAHIADIAPHLTANQIERRTAFIFGLINRHAIRESRRGLVRKFRAQIKRQFVKGKEFEELGVDIDRTLTGAVEEDARYVMRVCELSDKALDGETSALEKERARIEAIIAEREGMTDEHGNPLDVGGDDMQLRRALRQLALLDKYGAMVDMMPGEILDLTGEALASLGREALDLAARWAEYDRLVKRIKDPIVRSVSRKPTDPKAADTVLNKAADSTLSMLRQRLDWLTRYEGDPSKREEARAAISDLMNLLAEGHTAYATARADDRAALMKAMGEIFKKPDGRPDRRAIRAYLRRLDEKIPRALAGRLTRQGNQKSMTYGQMLHLLAYLDQWASYSDNIIRHDRRGQAALIRSFVYEDPKTGEARRALTSEDTQLLEWLRRAHYAGKRDVISNVMVRLCGREVESPDPLYHPVRVLQERRASLAAGARAASWQPLAGVFSRRRRHRLDVDESASILDMFENRSHETAVLTSFGEAGLVIREVLTSRAFQDAVRRFHGEKTLSRILRQVAQSLDGGRARGGGQSAAASLAQRVSTYMYLGFNLHSASKQTASLPVFAARMGFRKLGSILLSPVDREAVRRLRESDEYRARYGTGPASGMSAADREAYSGYDTSPLKRFFGDWGLAPTRWADAFVSLWVGQGVYRDYLAQYLDMGMSREDAERRAVSETYSLIEETQQSGRAENLPEMSREHGFLGRLMVQFATSPLQQMQYEIKEFAEWRDLVSNGGPEASIREARNKFMRAAFINHILVPGMMAALSNAFKLATGDEPDWERDGFLGELMIAAIMGQFGRIFFAGALTEQTLRVLFLRKPPYMGQLVPAEGVIRFTANLAYPVRDIVTWDTEHFRGDIMRLLKSIALTRVPARIYERATEGE
jgi:proteasome lid subunit RPN8/RPN11